MDTTEPLIFNFDGWLVFECLILIPYLAWGIYTLRLRYTKHEEIPLRIELMTLAAVTLFIAFDLMLVRVWMNGAPLLLALTTIGLFVSAAALYGPMVMSALSHVVAEVSHPSEHDFDDEYEIPIPHTGKAETLEREGDLDGALIEYRALAAQNPADPDLRLTVADLLARLGRTEESVEHFEVGYAGLMDSDRALRVANRLAEIYTRELHDPAQSLRVLKNYAQRFPQADRIESVHARITRLESQNA